MFSLYPIIMQADMFMHNSRWIERPNNSSPCNQPQNFCSKIGTINPMNPSNTIHSIISRLKFCNRFHPTFDTAPSDDPERPNPSPNQCPKRVRCPRGRPPPPAARPPPSRPAQREALRDLTAQRMAGDVRAVEEFLRTVEKCGRRLSPPG